MSSEGTFHTSAIRPVLSVGLVSVFTALLVTLIISTTAHAVQFDVTVDPASADSPSSVTSILTPDDGQDFFVTKGTTVKFPAGWKVNNPAGLAKCSLEAYGVRNSRAVPTCDAEAPGSKIGAANARAEIVPGQVINATGDMYLLESDASNDPVKVGVFIDPEGPIPPFRFIGNVTLEGDRGSERVIVAFSDAAYPPPPLPVNNFELTVSDILRTPASCGDYTFDSEITLDVPGNVDEVERPTRSVNLNNNCDVNFMTDAFNGPYNWDIFRPVMDVEIGNEGVTYSLKSHVHEINGDAEFRANNTAGGYASIKSANLALTYGGLNVDLAEAQGDVGSARIVVEAAAERHVINGEVWVAGESVSLVFDNAPQRIKDANGANSVVIEGIYNGKTSGVYDIGFLRFQNLPTAYEIRELSISFDSDIASLDCNDDSVKVNKGLIAASAVFKSDRLPLTSSWVTTEPCGKVARGAAVPSKSGKIVTESKDSADKATPILNPSQTASFTASKVAEQSTVGALREVAQLATGLSVAPTKPAAATKPKRCKAGKKAKPRRCNKKKTKASKK